MKNPNSIPPLKKHMEEAPVDVRTLAEELGISVSEELLADNIAGKILREGEGYKIVVNKMHPLTRQRFTIAHELGHYFLHSSKIGDGITEPLKFRNHKARGNPNIYDADEVEANKFAAGLLMPSKLVKPLQQEGMHLNDIASRLMVSRQALDIRMKSIN